MSMKATEDVVRSSATLRATVDFPEPEPPAIPMMSGLSIHTKATPPRTGTHYAFFGPSQWPRLRQDHNEIQIDVSRFSHRCSRRVRWFESSHTRCRHLVFDDHTGRQSGIRGHDRLR